MNRLDRRRREKELKKRQKGMLDYPVLLNKFVENLKANRASIPEVIYKKIASDKNYHALHMFGSAAFKFQNYDLAVKLFEKATALEPSNSSYCNDLGLALFNKNQNERAGEFLTKALDLDDTNFHAHINLANLRKLQGDLSGALESLEKAFSLNPTYENIHIIRGEVFLELGEAHAALQSLDRALKLAPANPWALSLKSIALQLIDDIDEFEELMNFSAFICTRKMEIPKGFKTLEGFNSRLGNYIETHRMLTKEPPHISTRKGSQTLGNILEDKNHLIEVMKEQIEEAVEYYIGKLPKTLEHEFFSSIPSAFRLEGWGVQLERQGYQEPHIHRGAWLSGVYYVSLGQIVGKDDSQGWIEFGRGPAQYYLNNDQPSSYLLCPEEGTFVLFPSYFWHRTIPFEKNQNRISFAFDVVGR